MRSRSRVHSRRRHLVHLLVWRARNGVASGILALGLLEAEEFRFPEALWVQTIYDFALAYHEKALHREHLLKSLTPLYLGQTASLVLRTRDGSPEDVERAIETLCKTFESMKPYLTQRWRFL